MERHLHQCGIGNLGGFSTNAEANCNDIDRGVQRVLRHRASRRRRWCEQLHDFNGGQRNTCSGGYAKPSWQTGTGVPADGKRDIPDISLFAGDGFAGSFYAVCEADEQNGNARNLLRTVTPIFSGYGGTSVSAQVFAGIVALIDQKCSGAREISIPPVCAGGNSVAFGLQYR